MNKQRKWAEEEVEDLKLGLSIGLTHEEIGEVLNRTKSSVMHKVQRENLAKPNTQWHREYTKKEILDLIRIYKTAEEFDYNPLLPGYKSCMKILNKNSWLECLKEAGLPTTKSGKWDKNKNMKFYVISFLDIDKTIFYKYGVTQRELHIRFGQKINPNNIIYQVIGSIEYCLELENKFSEIVNKYTPKDEKFFKNGHGGYTECFTKYTLEK